MRHTTDIRWFLQQLSNVAVYMAGNQVVNNGATNTISFNTELVDSQGEYNTGTYRFTPLRQGYYLTILQVNFIAGAAAGLVTINAREGGFVILRNGYLYAAASQTHTVSFSGVLYLTVGNFIDFNLTNQTGANITIQSGVSQSVALIERIPLLT
jgi:hypothetical protein